MMGTNIPTTRVLMLSEEIELLLRAELTAACTLESLLDQIFRGDNTEAARAALKHIAQNFSEEWTTGRDAMAHYRGMRSALDESDLRWAAGQKLSRVALSKLRGARLSQYRQYLDLFLLNIRITATVRRSAMELDADWSALGPDLLDRFRVAKYRLMLHLASILFRFSFDGALDLCDAAVFELFSLIYSRPLRSAA